MHSLALRAVLGIQLTAAQVGKGMSENEAHQGR
jgi:hypothetical protein